MEIIRPLSGARRNLALNDIKRLYADHVTFLPKAYGSFLPTKESHPEKFYLSSEDQLRLQLQSIIGSRSWRITKPLREGLSVIRRLRGLLIQASSIFQWSNNKNVNFLKYFIVAHVTRHGIAARKLRLEFNFDETFLIAQKSIAKSHFICKNLDSNSQSTIRVVISQDISFDAYLLFRFCLLWVKLGSNATIYCDFQEPNKVPFTKGNWDFIYNRKISLLLPMYMESKVYSSLSPIKISKALVTLRSVDTYMRSLSTPPVQEKDLRSSFKSEQSISVIIPTANKVINVDGEDRWLIENLVYEIGRMKRLRTQFVIIHNGNMTQIQKTRLRSLGDITFVPFLENQLNLSKKFNLGVKHAKYENLILANDDIAGKSKDWIKQLISWHDSGNSGVVAPKIFYESGLLQYAGIEITNFLPNILGYRGNASEQGYGFAFNVPRQLDAATGVLMATKKSVFTSVGGWDEFLPINFNDIEYCLRVRKAGYVVIFEPQAQIFHLESASRDQTLPYERDFLYFKKCVAEYNLKSIWPDLAKLSLTSSPHLGFDWLVGQLKD